MAEVFPFAFPFAATIIVNLGGDLGFILGITGIWGERPIGGEITNWGLRGRD